MKLYIDYILGILSLKLQGSGGVFYDDFTYYILHIHKIHTSVLYEEKRTPF